MGLWKGCRARIQVGEAGKSAGVEGLVPRFDEKEAEKESSARPTTKDLDPPAEVSLLLVGTPSSPPPPINRNPQSVPKLPNPTFSAHSARRRSQFRTLASPPSPPSPLLPPSPSSPLLPLLHSRAPLALSTSHTRHLSPSPHASSLP